MDESIDGVLGTWTRGGRMEGADKRLSYGGTHKCNQAFVE